MRLLLDSHVFLWLTTFPEQVAASIRQIVSDPDNDTLVSAATYWELSIKHKSGKLRLAVDFDAWVKQTFDEGDVEKIDITSRHGIFAGQLPAIHGDPFDRILIAQAILEDCTLVTRDQNIMRYAVPVMRA